MLNGTFHGLFFVLPMNANFTGFYLLIDNRVGHERTAFIFGHDPRINEVGCV